MINFSSSFRARLATGIFVIGGGLAAWHAVTDWPRAMPLIIFYGIIVAHAYFSIRCFANIIPQDIWLQNCIDFILFVLYLTLAFQLNDELLFFAIAGLLFSVATVKYATVPDTVHHLKLLNRKILADTLATIGSLLAVTGIVLGYGEITAITWTIILAIATIYLFWVNPLYAIQHEQ